MMLKFNFRREKDKEFNHIAAGLIPAASIAPKAAVPRTPPPRSLNPSPDRPRSALAAAILSSSLTGQTWAIPPARPTCVSETDRSESFTFEPDFSTALNARERWSEDLASRAHLSSPEHSEGELEDDMDNLENEEDHVYQTLDRQGGFRASGTVCDLPVETKSTTPPPTQMSGRRVPSPEGSSGRGRPPEATRRRECVRKSPENGKEDEPYGPTPPVPSTDRPRSRKGSEHLRHTSSDLSKIYSEVQREKKTGTVDEQKPLEKRLQRLEREFSQSQASSNLKSSAELQSLRQHAQELVDENDALKLTVHRLSVELSRYQTRFRPLSKQESSKSGLPKTGSPPPWLLDMKHLCPLLLAYEDRMNEQGVLLQTTEEEVKKLRVHVEEVIKENERLHDEISKINVVSQKDFQQLQEQAFLVLQENQVLIDQLEAQHVKAKASHNRRHSEATKMSKRLMLLEAQKQSLQEDLEESREDLQKYLKEVQVLKARLKDAVTWDEHCSIAGKLRRQLEEQESRNKSEMDQLLLRVSQIQEENRSLFLDKAKMMADVKTMKAELELHRQANRKAERRMSTLKRQKEVCMLKEENTRHFLGEVFSVAEYISKERDQLLHMASTLQQEKQGFVNRFLKGTVRFGQLQEEIKVYRRQASTRLAALEEAAEGRTASHQREILHLQRLLRERQEAEEKLLQSKREVEEELEVVWQAATRENQQMKETLLDSNVTGDLHDWTLCGFTPPEQPAQTSDETTRSSQQQQHKHGLDFYC